MRRAIHGRQVVSNIGRDEGLPIEGCIVVASLGFGWLILS
jgi:hypothetical protein